jgi:methylase of polypeptide subunit release factors
VYERIGDSLNDEPIHEIVFSSASRADFEDLDDLIPLFKGQPSQLQITDVEDFVDVLEDSISLLIDPLKSLYETIQPDEYELLLEIIPSGISENEFIQKTAASVVSKVLLLRALEDQNDQFGIVLNPDVIQSFAKSEYGYLLAYSSAYDLGGMKFPQVFKADIDVFDWWEPRELTSHVRSDARDAHLQMNNRLTNVLERLYRYEVEFEADLMGQTYQRLRKEGETSVLGAYYTPPALTDTTVQAVETAISDLDITDYDLYNLYEDPEFRMIDPTCGSGTFLLTYARKAIEYSDRADSDAANQIIRKTHGIDVDPLAVLMARAQIYGTLSGYLDTPPSPNIYWTDSLEHVRKYGADRSLMEFMDDYDQIQPPIDEVRYDIERAQDEITNSSFDLVIGNPPWGRRAEIVRHLTEAGLNNDDAEERVAGLVPSDWGDLFDDRDANLLTSFFKASDQLLKDGGIMALVLDARFQASGWGEEVIDTLDDYQEVRVLDASLSREAEFPESASYPAIVLGVK